MSLTMKLMFVGGVTLLLSAALGFLINENKKTFDAPIKHEYVIDKDGHCYSRIYRNNELGSFAYIPCPLLTSEAISNFRKID